MLVALFGLAYGQARDFPILPIDSWYTTIPLTGKSIVYDPVSDIAEIIYIPTPYDAHALYWAYSGDGGNTWDEMGPLDWGYGAAYLAIAMDGSQTPYVIFNDRIDHGLAENRALCFIRDESYLQGNWTTPMILSDTLAYSMRFGSIDVSPSGDTIVVVSQGNYDRIEGTDTLHVHDVLFTRSTNGGTSFDPMIVIAHGDDFPCDDGTQHYVESPAIHLGENGNIFVEALAKDTVNCPGEEWQKIYTASTDLGGTWTDVVTLPRPEGRTWGPENWWARLFSGVAMGDMVYTGACLSKAGENRLIGYRYRFSTGEFEEYASIAPPPAGDMFGEAACATFGYDAEGNIYVAYQDKDSLGFDGYNIFVMGSPDNGHYWTYPMRVGSGLYRPMAPEIAPIVGDSGLVIYEPMGWKKSFKGDSLRLIKFCADSVFAVCRTRIMLSHTAYGNTYDEVGPYVIQADAKDDQPGFTVDLIYVIGTDETTVPMVNVGGDTYEAEIPGQPIGTKIEYWVKAVDTDANEAMVPGSFDAGYSILVLPCGVVVYDDGIAIDGITEPWGNGFLSVRFSPTEAAVETLTTVSLFIWSNPDTFVIHLNPDDGTGKPNPDVDLITPIEAVAPDSGVWMDVDVGELFIPDEDFHIRIEFPLHDRPYIGADKLCDCDRSWMNYAGWWWAHPSDWGVGDLLIRAIMPGYGIGVEEGRTSIYRLSQNRPNPILKSTTIEFAIPKKEHVNLAVYNVAGQKVKTLVDGDISPGSYTINWNGRDKNGRRLAAGVYFYRMEAGKYISTRKLVLLR